MAKIIDIGPLLMNIYGCFCTFVNKISNVIKFHRNWKSGSWISHGEVHIKTITNEGLINLCHVCRYL